MKIWISIALATLLLVALALVRATAPEPPLPPPPKGVPIQVIAAGAVRPDIGLGQPFPDWAPLPDQGLVTGAEVIRPQPPYGSSAVIMMAIDQSYDAFLAGYRKRLAARGFDLRQVPTQIGLIIDRPVAQFEADERNGGHALFMAFRGDRTRRYVQLTFWAAPIPGRM